MNVIISNKQKNALDNANIEALKEFNGLFDVSEVINNSKGYFYSKMIIDATSIIDFAKENVLRKLVSGIGAEKIYLLLPPKPEPPKKFCDFLMSLGVYNFSTDINDILNFLKTPNSSDNQNMDAAFYNNHESNVNAVDSYDLPKQVDETVKDVNRDRKIILGFKNVTQHAGSTTLIYLIKSVLERKYRLKVSSFEFGTGNFKYFNQPNMLDINPNNIELSINNSDSNIILLDLTNDNFDQYCDDVIYLIEPSVIKVGKLLHEQSDIFTRLNNKKVVLNKSMLNNDDVNTFANEAKINIYFNIPYINDRVDNLVIEEFINKLGIAKDGQGILGLFK